MRNFMNVSFLVLCSVSAVRGDGLVFSLPEDKTAAVYKMEFITEQEGQKTVQQGSLTVASVGGLEVAQVKLRWLEIAVSTTAEENDKYRMIYKVLIPEKFLQEGGSPAECILKCWWTRKIRPGDEAKKRTAEPLEKHPHDSRWGLLPTLILTGALKEKKTLNAVEMETIFGKVPCFGVSGRFDYEQESRIFQTKVETRLHAKAPFGVVSSRIGFQIQSKGQMATGLVTFVLSEVIRNHEGELKKYQ